MKLYICQSLDGFIARTDGSIDFLEQFDNLIANSDNPKIVNTYSDFMSGIENVVEGYTTFKQIESIGYASAYGKYNHYVITNRHLEETNPHVTKFINFEQLQALNLNNQTTFLVGGSQIITEALNRELVSTIIITQLPIFLGDGIKLFTNIKSNPNLEIVDIFNDNNFYQVEYKVTYRKHQFIMN